MTPRPWLIAVAALLMQGGASAQDPRLQRVPYVAGSVVTVRVVPGYVASIMLSPDERIESIAVGNGNAWEVAPAKSGDYLFVKPMANGVATNVEVVTDSREYSFLLQTTFEGDPQAAFRVGFDYPQAGASAAPVAAGPVADRSPVTARVATTIYRVTGNALARPLSVVDDGVHTRFVFAPAATMPAIYAVDGEGNEALVTARQDGDGWLIDRIWPRYILRVGRATAQARRPVSRAAR